MSQVVMSPRQLSTQPSIVRAAGTLMVFAGGLLPLRAGSEAGNDPVVISLLITMSVAVCGLGVLFLASPRRVPPWGVRVIPWLVTVLTCSPAYVLGSGGDGVTPLLVCSALLGGVVLPRAVALLNAAVAVAVYAPATILVDSTAGVVRVGYLTAGCLAAMAVILPFRGEMLMMMGEALGRERGDELTGLLSRRGFDELVAHELAVCQRSGRSVALLTMEVDGFREIDEVHDPGAGDRVLRNTAQVLRSQMRGSDVLARAGHSEFGILLPACGTDDAVRRAEHIRSLLERTSAASPTPFTTSIGVASAPVHAETAADLAGAVAAALQAAREAGGNRIAIAPSRPASAWLGPGGDGASSGISAADSVVLP